MSLIIACLLPLIVLTVLSVIMEEVPLGLIHNLKHMGLHGDVDLGITKFSIDPIEGALVFVITFVALASTVGIHILASGLAEQSVRVLTLVIIYIGLWGILSILAIDFIFDIEIFGALIYILLTIGYAIGIIQKIAGG